MSAEQAAAAIRARWPNLKVTLGEGAPITVLGFGWRAEVRRLDNLRCHIRRALVSEWAAQVTVEACPGALGGEVTALMGHPDDPCKALELTLAHVARSLADTAARLARVAAEMATATDRGGA